MNKIDNFNRNLAIERYVEDLVAPMHLLDCKETLKDYMRMQKAGLGNDELEEEIRRHDPGLLADIYSQELYANKTGD